jgi:hypothetical protein
MPLAVAAVILLGAAAAVVVGARLPEPGQSVPAGARPEPEQPEQPESLAPALEGESEVNGALREDD